MDLPSVIGGSSKGKSSKRRFDDIADPAGVETARRWTLGA